jgi:Flp pilus assembly protein TadD
MWSAALLTAGALGAPTLGAQVPAAAPAAAAPAAADSVGLFELAALQGRQAAQHFEEQAAHGRAARPDAGAAAYFKGVLWITRDNFDSAVAALRTAVTASANVARYHGDLAFALAGAGRFADAEVEYKLAVQLQQSNAWYYVGLGASQVAQERWPQAAASFTLGVSTDSAVVVQQLIGPASDAFQHAGMAEALEDWSRMATVKFPNEPLPWLRLASACYRRQDTTAGFPAIRHYRSVRPDDRTGALLYAEYLLAAARYDSAAILAQLAVPDTSLQRLAGVVLYNAGGHLLQTNAYARAAEVLQQARPLANPPDQPRIDLFLGVAKLRMLQDFYNEAAQHTDCRKAHQADSMLIDVTHLVTAGVAVDSALATQVLTGAVHQYRTAIDGFVTQCKNR